MQRVVCRCRFSMDEESVQWLAEMCDGDARIGLNSLQMTLNAYTNTTGSVHITLDDIKDGIKVRVLMRKE